MKAVWYDRLGAAQDVLQFGELPTPEPAAGEVRVRLEASAVNPADANRRAGRMHQMEFERVIPNSDGAGIIDAVGAGVDVQRVGQRVWVYFGQRGRPWGTAAEFICLPEELVCELPAHMNFAQGACLGIPAISACCSLLMHGDIRGKTVLVTGGAGAVGHYAIQLAKWAGAAQVLTTVSSTLKAEHARHAGADVVIDYTRQDVVQAAMEASGGAGVDHVVDVDANTNLDAVLALLAPSSTWVCYAIGPDQNRSMPWAQLIRRNITLRGLYLSGLAPEVRRQARRKVAQWAFEVPKAVHAVDSIYPLSQTAAAHQLVETRNKLGTVVVSCR